MTKFLRASASLGLGLLLLSPGSLWQDAAAADASTLPHFEFAAPAGDAWTVDRSADAMGGVRFFLKQGKAGYQIALLENVVLNAEMRKAPAATIADDFRAQEKAGMEELGVAAGQYRLSDLVMGQVTIDGTLYYTMTYVTEARDHYQRAGLYLHFPYPENNQYFLVAHYSEMAPRRSDLKLSHEADFRQLLGTVSHRPGEQADAATAGSAPPPGPGMAPDFARVHAMTQSALPRARLSVRCQVKVDEAYVSLIETPETGVAWVAFTAKKFSNPARNLLTRMYFPGERGGTTMDWGYILDRNRDGRVDYLAFLIGTACVAPEPCEEALPNLNATLTPHQVADIISPNVRLIFWHVADDDGDGEADLIAVPLSTVANGWIEGWLVTRDANFDHVFEECRHFAGPLRSDLGACEGTPAAYAVPGYETMGLRRVPPGDLAFLQMIDRAVRDCGLAAETLLDSSP